MKPTRILLCLLALAGCGARDPEAPVQELMLTHRIITPAAGDPLPGCDPAANPPQCEAGQRCGPVVRREPGAAGFDVQTACYTVEADAPSLDEACAPWNGGQRRLSRPGLAAEVYADPCVSGLSCSNAPTARDSYRCRPSCDLEREQLCGAGEFCYSGATALQSACLVADGCDPTRPDSCGPDASCYLRPNDAASGLLTECLPMLNATPLPDASACESTLDCQPGSWCWGPSSRRPGEWSPAEQYCRRTCDASYDDAEVCPAGMICRELVIAKQVLDFSQLPVPLGQCELH